MKALLFIWLRRGLQSNFGCIFLLLSLAGALSLSFDLLRLRSCGCACAQRAGVMAGVQPQRVGRVLGLGYTVNALS